MSYGRVEVDATLLLLLKVDVRRLFVETDAKSFEFLLNNALVLQRLEHVQHNQNEGARPRHRNHL